MNHLGYKMKKKWIFMMIYQKKKLKTKKLGYNQLPHSIIKIYKALYNFLMVVNIKVHF